MPRHDARHHCEAQSRGPARSRSTTATSRALWILLSVVLPLTAGCHTRYVAPEVSYDPGQVQKIRQTIDEIDWTEYE